MIISSHSFRRLASRVPATIQAGRAQYLTSPQPAPASIPKPSPAHIFSDQASSALEPAASTGMLPFDLSSKLGTAYPATTANLLARYLVVREGEEHEFLPQATSVLCYVIKGSGRTFREDEVIEWTSGDAFLFPGGESLLFEAPDGNAVVFIVTDEPLLASIGCVAPPGDDAKVQSAHYTAKTIAAQIEDMRAAETPPPETILKFGSAPFAQKGCVAPAMAAGVATLEPGAEQGEHCHDADTILLCLECEGVYSLVDGARADWVPNAALLMPAGAAHSQHNPGEKRMLSFYVQDRGPRDVRTWEPGTQHARANAHNDAAAPAAG
jgi:gentisate 1,2-dioxygenase